MRISDLKDKQAVETVKRFGSMIARIKSTENSIMARARAIESGESVPGLSLGGVPNATMGAPSGAPVRDVIANRPLEAADLPGLFLAERMVGETDDILSIEFFETGLLAKRPVGRILDGMGSFATGFLVGKGLMMTAAHALPDPATASLHEFQMDFEAHSVGAPVNAPRYSLDPDRFFFANHDYDVAVVAVTDFTGFNPPLESFGWFVLDGRDETITAPQPVSIIQHPNGREKSVVVHNSRFVHCDNGSDDARYCWYTGDTDRGSSGSPVFDPHWNILAVHHQAIPNVNAAGEVLDQQGKPIKLNGRTVDTIDDLHSIGDVGFIANQGVRQSRIFNLLQRSRIDNPAQDDLREELLQFWRAPGAKAKARAAAMRGVGLV